MSLRTCWCVDDGYYEADYWEEVIMGDGMSDGDAHRDQKREEREAKERKESDRLREAVSLGLKTATDEELDEEFKRRSDQNRRLALQDVLILATAMCENKHTIGNILDSLYRRLHEYKREYNL